MLPDDAELGWFRILEDLAFQGSGVLEAGTELVALNPSEEERKRLFDLAPRAPHIVARWNERRRLIPQSAVEALDDAAVGTLELCQRLPKAPKPKPPPDPEQARREIERSGLLHVSGPEDGARLLEDLRRLGIYLRVARDQNGARVWACGVNGSLTPEVRARVQANQGALMKALREAGPSEVVRREQAVVDWMERPREDLSEAAA